MLHALEGVVIIDNGSERGASRPPAADACGYDATPIGGISSCLMLLVGLCTDSKVSRFLYLLL